MSSTLRKIVDYQFRFTGAEGGLSTMTKLSVGAAAVATAAIAAGRALWNLADRTTQVYGEFDDLAGRTGVAASQLHALSIAAQTSGVEFEGILMAFRRLPAAIDDMNNGLATAVRSFDAVGLTAQDLEGLSIEDQFYKVADALIAVEDESTRAALAQDFFGRSGMNLLPFLEQGSEGIRALADEARAAGMVLEDDAYAAADHFQDKLVELRTTLQSTTMSALEPMLPQLETVAETLMDTAVEVLPSLMQAITNLIPVVEQLLTVLKPASEMLGGVALISANWDPLHGRFGGLFGDTVALPGSNLFEQYGVGGQMTRLNMILDRLRDKTDEVTEATEEVAESITANVGGAVEDVAEEALEKSDFVKQYLLEQARARAEEEYEIAREQAEKQANINIYEAEQVRAAEEAALAERTERIQQFANVTTDIVGMAWDAMFGNTRQSFEDMLKDMMMALMKSGLLKLLGNLVTGGASGGLGFLF